MLTDDGYRQIMQHARRLAQGGRGELAQHLRDAIDLRAEVEALKLERTAAELVHRETATTVLMQMAEVQRLKQERDGLKNRLEWRHDGGPDGISARDETIKMQDAEVQRLRDALKPFAAIDLTTNQAVDPMDVLRARRALRRE